MFQELDFSATQVQLEPGDTLFLYTDGLTEASGAEGEFGVERVAQLVRQHGAREPAELIAACLNDLRAFADGPAVDDLTLLAIRRTSEA